jgi:hypothetical protein
MLQARLAPGRVRVEMDEDRIFPSHLGVEQSAKSEKNLDLRSGGTDRRAGVAAAKDVLVRSTSAARRTPRCRDDDTWALRDARVLFDRDFDWEVLQPQRHAVGAESRFLRVPVVHE